MTLVHISNIKIPYTSDRFETFVTCPVIVDKSLFIHQVFALSSHCLITHPRRWGKSLNLDMLNNFLKLEDDEKGNPVKESSNSKYFLDSSHRKLKINDTLSQNIIQSYLGQHPVIYLPLLNMKVLQTGQDEYVQAKNSIIEVIRSIFRK